MADTPPVAIDDAAKARAALLGAIPLVRMVDCGMDVGSAQRVIAAVTDGGALDIAAESEAHATLASVERVSGAARLPLLKLAIAQLVVAQLPFNEDADRKRELYAAIRAQVAVLASEAPERYSVVGVPFGGAELSALLVTPPGVQSPPAVILFGGLSGWGAAYLSIADQLAASGLACLLVELPGQGATRLEGVAASAGVVEAVSACVDWLIADERVSDGVGVWGNSFGGLFAALAAARDPRIGACVVNGAPAVPFLPPFRTAQELMFSFFGTADPDALAAQLDGITFGGRGLAITQPLLVLHGGADVLVPRSDQEPFLAAGGPDSTWREWPDGLHAIYNHAVERNALVANWFGARLR
jgi:dienelactone hydrolase